jgi:hypothetical protein
LKLENPNGKPRDTKDGIVTGLSLVKGALEAGVDLKVPRHRAAVEMKRSSRASEAVRNRSRIKTAEARADKNRPDLDRELNRNRVCKREFRHGTTFLHYLLQREALRLRALKPHPNPPARNVRSATGVARLNSPLGKFRLRNLQLARQGRAAV